MTPRPAGVPTQAICPQTYPLDGRLTILNRDESFVKDPGAIALAALAWVLAEPARAQRFLDLTGLTPDTLRAALGEPSTQRAVLEFLCAHEPDLLAASQALALSPGQLVAANEALA